MKFAFAIVTSLVFATVANAGSLSTTSVPTTGLAGFETHTVWYTADGAEVFQGIDATFSGALNQVNPFGLDSTFQNANGAIPGAGGDVSQDSQWLFLSGDILSIGAGETAASLFGAISGIHLVPGGIVNPTPFAQIVIPTGDAVNVDVILELDNASGIDFRYQGSLEGINGVPEPTTAILAMLGLVGVAARRRS